MLIAQNISLTLLSRQVLHNISANFAPGKMSIILGPNGAGKSSLLSCLAALRRVDSGSVMLDDTPLADMNANIRARKIGFLPQEGEVNWDIDAGALVALGRYPYQRGWGLSKDDEIAINNAMAATKTEIFMHRNVARLSGGERARVLMARILAGTPDWILADEPLANLDPHYQIEILRQLKKQTLNGKGVVAILHDLTAAAAIADHIILLKNGEIAASGTAAQVMQAQILEDIFETKFDIGQNENGKLLISCQY
ncbi:hypothetical protein LPB140_04780 [Sphingorhabdus lutea]|uniref:ABC transporter domain-containing protein n=1 Tax=Sphingorhabdus lutea TaxID=1913578 RepID=A0A1L3JAT4_9SPHN|nr:ABC transporter ATP-binding protein [Sphingorhabdus lutea]APG62228.1 hypothetical protein LPB140_04780 [Sphingorhabdus lutea]